MPVWVGSSETDSCALIEMDNRGLVLLNLSFIKSLIALGSLLCICRATKQKRKFLDDFGHEAWIPSLLNNPRHRSYVHELRELVRWKSRILYYFMMIFGLGQAKRWRLSNIRRYKCICILRNARKTQWNSDMLVSGAVLTWLRFQRPCLVT